MGKIKNLHDKLDRLEPWNDRENRGLSKRDKAFIRDIQIVNKVTKDKALNIYTNANLKSKDALKKLGKSVRGKIKKYIRDYPKEKDKTNNKEVTKFVPPSKKQKTKKSTKTGKSEKQTSKKESPKLPKKLNPEVKKYLEDIKNQKHKTYAIILKRSKEHPQASLYELRHSYNSIASQKYREKHKK